MPKETNARKVNVANAGETLPETQATTQPETQAAPAVVPEVTNSVKNEMAWVAEGKPEVEDLGVPLGNHQAFRKDN